MKDIFKQSIQLLARPLLGKGLVDRYVPFLNVVFQYIYTHLSEEREIRVETPLKTHLFVSSKDTGIGLPLILKHEYEPLETKLFLEVIKPGNTVIDIGANIGYYTVLASKKVGKRGRVIAFEADKKTLPLLSKNLSENQCNNTLVEKAAVTEKIGPVRFSTSALNIGESGLAVGQHGYKVPGVTLDSYCEQNHITQIDALKMDIEGAEIQALRSATVLTQQPHLTAFIEYNPASLRKFGHQPEELLELIEKRGLKIKTIIDESRSQVLPYSEGNLKRVLNHTTYCNLLCTK